jgi:hypothetical protein
VTATFSEPVTASTISFVLKDSNNNTVASTVAYNAGTQTATLTPNAALSNSIAYTATVSGATDSNGNVMTPVSWSFTTVAVGITSYSFWSNSTTPAVADDTDTSSLELGVKFTSSVAGQVTGIRFYKGPTNTGTHVGDLWSSTGQLLATATFSGESASGWQTVTFSQPVTIQANTVYVASYHTNVGQYAANSSYFASSGVTSGPITALSNSASGGNGVYGYGSAGTFPTSAYQSTNYWVDIVFTPIPPTVTAKTPAAGATGVATSTTVTATFSGAVTASTISFVLKDASNNTVPATVAYNASTQTATLTPNAALNASTTYTATVSGATDAYGDVMAPVSWSFTTGANQWVQSTVADFSAGTQSNTVVTNAGGGQVQLAQTSDDFTGTALGSAWTTTSWASAGGGPASVTVANSILSVGGAQVASGTVTVGTPFEASASFAAAPYQHFGLASSLSAVAGSYWAIFSTLGTTNTLYARLNINGTTQDVSLGALPSGFHDYLIQPVSGGFQFYVDGTLKTTINGTIPTGTALKATFSEYGGSPLAPMQVDWVRYSNFASSGTFTSSVFNAGKTATIASATWAASVPAGTTMTVQVRASSNGTNWSSWQTITSGGSISPTVSGQYFQYQVIFTTTSLALTPTFSDITFNWS